eukprot:6207976-Pleurochrysis_carterae.AAC.1
MRTTRQKRGEQSREIVKRLEQHASSARTFLSVIGGGRVSSAMASSPAFVNRSRRSIRDWSASTPVWRLAKADADGTDSPGPISAAEIESVTEASAMLSVNRIVNGGVRRCVRRCVRRGTDAGGDGGCAALVDNGGAFGVRVGAVGDGGHRAHRKI